MTAQPETFEEVARHRRAVETVRERREESLRDPMGWLTLVGLHWIEPGTHRFGSGAANEIVLQAEEAEVPPLVGRLDVAEGQVRVRPEPGAALTVDGEPVPDGLRLIDDDQDEPTVLELASLRMYLIRRGRDRLALRVKDTAVAALRTFAGLDFFPVDPAWRVTGRLIPAEPGATIRVPDIVGDLLAEPTPGDVVFELRGASHRLHALESIPGHLWLIYGDDTNGNETYGGGRFLVTGPIQPDDSVEIDFNLTYNPPCVFSPFATCPLPPDGNRLALRVEAGEKVWGTRPARSTLPP